MCRGIRKWGTVIGILSVLCTGCSGSSKDDGRVGVFGMTTLNGKPLDQGSIQFEPMDPKQGSLSGGMITRGAYDVPAEHGLKPGKYRVRISSVEVLEADRDANDARTRRRRIPGMDDKLKASRERIPEKYNKKSEEIVELKKGERNKFDFKIE